MTPTLYHCRVWKPGELSQFHYLTRAQEDEFRSMSYWIAETETEILPDDAAEEHDRQMEIGFAREGY